MLTFQEPLIQYKVNWNNLDNLYWRGFYWSEQTTGITHHQNYFDMKDLTPL